VAQEEGAYSRDNNADPAYKPPPTLSTRTKVAKREACMRDTMVLGHVGLWLVMPAVDTVGFTDGDLLGVGGGGGAPSAICPCFSTKQDTESYESFRISHSPASRKIVLLLHTNHEYAHNHHSS